MDPTEAHIHSNLAADAFRAIITKDIEFFDNDDNNAGDLTEFLASTVTRAEALFGDSLNSLVKVVAEVTASLVCVYIWGQWQLSLISMVMIPIISLSAMSRTKSSGTQRNSRAVNEVAHGKAKSDSEKFAKDDFKSAGTILGEVVLSVRTVISFNSQEHFLAKYTQHVLVMAQKARADLLCSALSVGLLEGTTPPLVGFMMWYGTYVSGSVHGRQSSTDGSCTGGWTPAGELIEGIMVPMMVTFWSSAAIGAVLGNMTGVGEAAEAAKLLFERLDETPKRYALSHEGRVPSDVMGVIDLRDVVFTYPAALERPVCRGCTLHIDAGQVCALVGPSGSGKSTVVALLERFYDPQGGAVLLDGVDIRTLNLRWLRSQLGLVGQEPVLFMGTVAENIAYGKPGVTAEQIEAAARMANAHTFITESLGLGYETQVGLGGGKLSGGQKQRVAIARALVRKPAVLLLDEATSALDNESERVVQAALDEVMTREKRTTVVIAHRLSTIRNADSIAVVYEGQILEQGTHDQLLSNRNLYANLVMADSGGAAD